MKIKIELSKKEADELLMVASNGFGDGDYYGLNGQDGWAKKSDAKYFLSAYEKLAKKLKRQNIQP